MEIHRNAPIEVTVRLSYDEALVLSDLLTRWERDRALADLPFADQAERTVIMDLTASFEPIIDEVFGDTYSEVIAEARRRVGSARG